MESLRLEKNSTQCMRDCESCLAFVSKHNKLEFPIVSGQRGKRKTLQKILRNNWHPFGYYSRQQRCLVCAWNVYLCITFYCFITTHFLCLLLLPRPRLPVLGMHLLHGFCLRSWAIQLRLSVTHGIWSHRTVLQGLEKAKGKDSKAELYGPIRKLPVINPAEGKTSLV